MSKKTKKPRTGTKQAASPEKSSRAVKTGIANESTSADSVDEQQGSTAPAQAGLVGAVSGNSVSEPLDESTSDQQATLAAGEHPASTGVANVVPTNPERSVASTSSLPPGATTQYQSMVPPTDDIDDAWGSDDGNGADVSSLAVVAATPKIAVPTQESTASAETVQAAPAEPDDEKTATDVRGPPISSAPPPSAEATVTESSAPAPQPPQAAREPVSSSANQPANVVASRSVKPPSATVLSRPSAAPPPSARSAPTSTGPNSRPSRAPVSVRPKPASIQETRPSGAPGSLKTTSTAAGERRVSVPPDHATHSAGHSEAASSAPLSAEVNRGDKGAATPAPEAGSSPATNTPIATRTPLSVLSNTEPTIPQSPEPTTTPVAAASAQPMPSSIPAKPNRVPVWTLLWLTSVAAAGVIGWFARPTPRPVKHATECECGETRTTRQVASAPPQQLSPTPASALPAAAPAESTSGTTPSGEGSQGAPTVASATEPASTLPVVVETESNDRISVTVNSNPNGVRVWRRGKSIGRTPLVIQIGRGERRVFEIGSPGYGTRRLSLNGEKTDITVNLYAPGVK